ncbi:hypothetical protein LEP1GSC021_4967, partial [Leptospira noguchii str. 1993005606]
MDLTEIFCAIDDYCTHKNKLERENIESSGSQEKPKIS